MGSVTGDPVQLLESARELLFLINSAAVAMSVFVPGFLAHPGS